MGLEILKTKDRGFYYNVREYIEEIFAPIFPFFGDEQISFLTH